MMTAPHDASDPTAVSILNAALMHVPFDGWTEAAMQTTADQLGLSASQMTQLFPQGITGLVETGSDDIDRHMAEIFMNRFADDMDMMQNQRAITADSTRDRRKPRTKSARNH